MSSFALFLRLNASPESVYAVLDEFLCSKLNMAVNTADAYIYTRNADGSSFIIAVYVDNLLSASSCVDELRKGKHALSSRFNMKNVGESRLILGMEILRSRELGWLTVSQTRYPRKIIERIGLEEAKGTTTPMQMGIDMSETCGKHDCPYREATGSRMYLAVDTRPDISFAVSV